MGLDNAGAGRTLPAQCAQTMTGIRREDGVSSAGPRGPQDRRTGASGSSRRRADPLLQRFVERVAGGEGLFERATLTRSAPWASSHPASSATLSRAQMQGDEPVRIDVLPPIAGHRVESLLGRFDDRTCRRLGSQARTSRDFSASSLAAMRARMARAACLAFGPQGAVSEAIRVACERRIVAVVEGFQRIRRERRAGGGDVDDELGRARGGRALRSRRGSRRCGSRRRHARRRSGG